MSEITYPEMVKRITKIFEPYIVRRAKGQCQVLFALTELDKVVDGIIEITKREDSNANIQNMS